MGSFSFNLDLFCSGCSNALQIESSSGHHVLVEPCVHCMQTKVEQTVEKVRDEETKEGNQLEGREKLAEWKADEEKRKKELENITVAGVAQEGEGYDE